MHRLSIFPSYYEYSAGHVHPYKPFIRGRHFLKIKKELKMSDFSQRVGLALKLIREVYLIHYQNPDRKTSVLLSMHDVTFLHEQDEFKINLVDANVKHVISPESHAELDNIDNIGLKNDIYTLSKIVEKILKGTQPKIFETFQVDLLIKRFLQEMCAEDLNNRPDIETVIQFFTLLDEIPRLSEKDLIPFVGKLFLVGNDCYSVDNNQSINDPLTLKIVAQLSEYDLLSKGIVDLLIASEDIRGDFSVCMSENEHIELLKKLNIDMPRHSLNCKNKKSNKQLSLLFFASEVCEDMTNNIQIVSEDFPLPRQELINAFLA